MNKQKLLLLFLCLFVVVPLAYANLDPPENIHIVHDTLSWDPVLSAAGYNIYLGEKYHDTIIHTEQYPLIIPGVYRVVAFDIFGEHYSNMWDSEPVAYQPKFDSVGVVLQTGQKTSYYPGDDGDWQAGVEWPVPRFTINVIVDYDFNSNGICDGQEICDGTVTDNLTKLVWLQNANCFGKQPWRDAIELANSLVGDGNTCDLKDGSKAGDWRVPNIRELQSLLDYSQAVPSPLLPDGHPFINVAAFEPTEGIEPPNGFPASYWTSTATGNDSAVYTLSLAVGWVERWSLGVTNFYSWQVRHMK